MSDRDVTHSDLVEIAKQNGDFRKNYGVIVGAILYLRSINAARPRLFWWQAVMASYRSCVGLLVAMNKIDNTAREMNADSIAAKAVLRYQSCGNASRPTCGRSAKNQDNCHVSYAGALIAVCC